MTAALRRKLARRLAARSLHESVQGDVAETISSTPQTISSVPAGCSVPLSYAQERMWFLHQLDPAASAYNVCLLWHLRGELGVEALRRSIFRVVERHTILRTVYSTDSEGQARQEVLSSLPPEWSREDLRMLGSKAQTKKYQEIVQHASTAQFDLNSRSTMRVVLFALTDIHHVLLLVGQHIIWDGPSFGVFCRELADGYNFFHTGKPDLYQPLPSQYIDFARWHREQWQSDSPQRSSELAFWEKELTPLPEPLDFPVDFKRGASNDETGEWCAESLGGEATAVLMKLAAQEQVSPFVVLISAIAVVMTRLARTSEMIIGTTASRRNLPELEGLIGNFSNIVPLRISVPVSGSFRDLIRHCATRCQAAFSHADMPFECLLEHLNIPRGQASPLIDTMVIFLSRGLDAPSMDGLEVDWEKHFNRTSQYGLSFDALLLNDGLQLMATWQRDLYRPGTAHGHLRRLVKLLRESVSEPDAPLAVRSLLLPEEHEQLKTQWSTRSSLPAEADTLVAWFEQCVRQHPKKIALRSARSIAQAGEQLNHRDENSLSFATLNARANTLARWLVTHGIGPEDRVALVLPRQPEWFVAMLATLKAGASFVPIDPSYPAEYIEGVLQQAKPVFCFIDPSIDQTLTNLRKATSNESLSVAEQLAQSAGLPSHDLSDAERRCPLRPSHPVCVVFTSGSSGAPKGVVVPHAALVNLLSSHRVDLYEKAYQLTGRRHLRIGHAWSLAFDAAWQPALWMFEGHEIHLFDTDITQDPIELAREIILRRLDFIELIPGMLDEVLPWLQSGLTEADGTHLPGHVPAILGFGGESVKQALWNRILTLEGVAGFNLYGPTEATVDAMIARATADQPPNIGGPVAGAQVYVLDTCLQLAPPGVPGELAIAGAGLARGYLGRGDLTASQFIANPFGEPGTRLYRTGDRVRWLGKDALEYLGRIDEQIKVRGFRVEPLEVEASVEKIAEQPCAVVARPSGGEMQLLCFVETGAVEQVVNAENSPLDVDRLLQLCSASLPSHLVPKHIITIDRMPRLPNGKINRRALVLPEGLDAQLQREPRNALERQLCELFANVLGRKKVGIDDGFFELGGDSISVVKLVSRARREGVILTARQVFDARSVVRLAMQLESTTNASSDIGSTLPEHDRADTGMALPTPLMSRYLSLEQPLNHFAQLISLSLPSGISDAELDALFAALVQRHALLRASLAKTDSGAPCLNMMATGSLLSADTRSYCLLSDADANFADTSPVALVRVLCEQLDPQRGCMLAAARLRREPGQADSLWLAGSHLILDAGSWHVLAADLALGRAIQKRGDPIELPAVPTAWKTWSGALKQRNNAGPDARLAGGTLVNSCRLRWVLPLKQEHQATGLARRLGVSLASVFSALTPLAAQYANILPGRYNGKICLHVQQPGREPSALGQDLSRTIGLFTREVSLSLQAPTSDGALTHECAESDQLIILLRKWCVELMQLDGVDNQPTWEQSKIEQAQPDEWQLGFNFLDELAADSPVEEWVPQSRLDVLMEASGEHWPLLNELDITAYSTRQGGERRLCFDAISASESVDEAALQRLFQSLQLLIDTLSANNSADAGYDRSNKEPGGVENLLPVATELREVTPLQYEMLRQCQGDTDPWTTQLELCLVSTPAQPLTADSLKQGAVRLISRHSVLRAGFLSDCASTFVASNLEPDWQALDWRGETEERQEVLLTELRREWYSKPFRLDQPPLLRFIALHLSGDRWRVLVNCHHLLLDGWSAPRVLHDLLADASGTTLSDSPPLSWESYLDVLQTQDRGASLRYWNRVLEGFKSPSLLCPERTKHIPSEHEYDALSVSQSEALTQISRKLGISPSAVYQLAWARTLSTELGQSDVVFGLFDSGRTASIDGLETLVGLVTQLVPVRIGISDSFAAAEQLRELQAKQFEWQALAPVRLDNLMVTQTYGEIFDTLLVIENALDADTEITKSLPEKSLPLLTTINTSTSLLEEQRWHDSIGQTAGLFVYPGNPVQLRLCRDPLAIDVDVARRLLTAFKQHLCHLLVALGADPTTIQDTTGYSPQRFTSIPLETTHE